MNMENRQAYSHPLGLQNCSDIKVERSESQIQCAMTCYWNNACDCVNYRPSDNTCELVTVSDPLKAKCSSSGR